MTALPSASTLRTRPWASTGAADRLIARRPDEHAGRAGRRPQDLVALDQREACGQELEQAAVPEGGAGGSVSSAAPPPPPHADTASIAAASRQRSTTSGGDVERARRLQIRSIRASGGARDREPGPGCTRGRPSHRRHAPAPSSQPPASWTRRPSATRFGKKPPSKRKSEKNPLRSSAAERLHLGRERGDELVLLDRGERVQLCRGLGAAAAALA